MPTVDDYEYKFLSEFLGEDDSSLSINDLRYRYYAAGGSSEVADSAVAALVADPESATATQLSAAIVAVGGESFFKLSNAEAIRFAPGLRYGFIGDSITNGSNAGNFTYSYASEAVQIVGGLIARADSFTSAVPGQTSAGMLARFDTFLSYEPDVVVIMAGINDSGQNVPVATYASNVSSMIQRSKAAGKAVIVCTVSAPKPDLPADQFALLAGYNAWIRFYAPGLGCEVADTYEATVDTALGTLAAAYSSSDGPHPNQLGHYQLAVAVAKAMKRAANRSNQNLVTSVWMSGNLVTDPLCANAAGGATKPVSFFEWPGGTGAAPTYSLVADTSTVLTAGKWVQMDMDGSASGGTRILSSPAYSAGFAVGDVLAIVAQVQIEDVSGDWVSKVTSQTAQTVAAVVNQSGIGVTGAQALFRCPGIKDAAGFYDVGTIFSPFTVPSGTTALNLRFNLTVPTGSHYKLRVGTIGLLNLTTMGVSDPSLLGFGNIVTQK